MLFALEDVMEMEMNHVRVFVSDANYVCIEQVEDIAHPQTIVLHPAQVDALIVWLNEAKGTAKSMIEKH